MAYTFTEVINNRVEELTKRLSTCNTQIDEIKQQEPTPTLIKDLTRLLLIKDNIARDLESWSAIK